jgi:hypothetical protein
MDITPAGLILSGLEDVRDRYVRVIQGLAEASHGASLGAREVLASLRSEVLDEVIEHSQKVSDRVTIAQVASAADDPTQWGEEHLEALATLGSNAFDRLGRLHAKIFHHIPRKAETREDIKFLLFRALKLSELSDVHSRMVTVSPSNFVEWDSTSVTSSVRSGFTAAVNVPWMETLTPLRWPLLVHELGHYMLPHGIYSVEQVVELSESHGWVDLEFVEVLADAVAESYFGDSYGFVLAREGYLVSASKHAQFNLSIDARLRLLAGPADLKDALPPSWHLDTREQLDRKDHQPTDIETLQLMRETAVSLVGPMNCNRQVVVEQCRKLLKNREPCPSVYVHNAEQAAGEQAGAGASEVDELLMSAVNTPARDGEIYEALWREDLEKDLTGRLERLLRSVTADSVDIESRQVLDSDIWAARSLQSAAVHRWLVQDASEPEPVGGVS